MDGQNQLFNLHCNGGVFNLGHRNAELSELLIKSLATFDIGNHHLMSRVRAGLAELIAALMPGDLNYTVFGVGGGLGPEFDILKRQRPYKHQQKQDD